MRIQGVLRAVMVGVLACLVVGCGGKPLASTVTGTATYRDYYAALTRFENTLYRQPRSASEWASINPQFDQAITQPTFSEAIRRLDELSWKLDPAIAPKTREERIARALRVRVWPWLGTLPLPRSSSATVNSPPFPGQTNEPQQTPLRFMASLLYPVDVDPDTKLSFSFRGEIIAEGYPTEGTINSSATTRPTFVSAAAELRRSGTAQVLVQINGSEPYMVGTWSVMRAEDQRALNPPPDQYEARLRSSEPSISHAAATYRARADVLRSFPSEEDSAVFTLDPDLMAQNLRVERLQLLAAVDPYKGYVGDMWRAALSEHELLPFRLYSPRKPVDSKPDAMIVVFHDQGGDESSFFNHHAMGRIKKLADHRGFLIVAARTEPFLENPELFHKLRESCSVTHSIDSSRIYVIGHGSGGKLASILASRGMVKAACVISSPVAGPTADAVPIRVYVGSADNVTKPSAVVQSTLRWQSTGKLSYVEKSGWGHTLIVPEVLPEAVDWLLKQ